MAAPQGQSQIPSSPQEWTDYYTKLIKRNTLPKTREESSSAGTYNLRDLIVDISTIKVSNAFVYADVLTAPSDVTLDFTSGGFIFLICRIFSATADRQITINVDSHDTKFILYSPNYTPIHKLSVVFSKGGTTLGTYDLTPTDARIGLLITYRANPSTITNEPAGMSTTPLTVLNESIQDEPLLGGLLQTQLRIAALTMFTYPTLSTAILLFICRLTNNSRFAAPTHLEASTILSQLLADLQHAGDPNTCTVPSVTMSVYESAVAALLDTASAYSEQYDRFIDKKDDSVARHDAVIVMANQNKDAIATQAQLLAQAKSTWDDSLSAMQTAHATATTMESVVHDLSVKFSDEVKAWQAKQQLLNIFKIIASVITFAVAIGSVAAGNPAGATAAPGIIAEAAQLGKTMADVIKAAAALTTDVATVSNQMVRINKIVDTLDSTITETENNITAISSGTYDPAQHAQRLSAPDPDSINAVAAWDAWRVGVENSMKSALDNHIPTAGDYLVALQRQSIYGKAQCLTKAAAVKAGQEYARALLQYQTAQAQQGRLDSWKNDIDDKLATYDVKAAAFFDQLLNVKTFAVIQIRNYTDAYKYFSLRRSAVVIDMEKDMLELKRDFSTMKQELASYLAVYSSDPQPYTVTLLSADLPLNQSSVVADLIASGKFSLTFDTTNRGPFTSLFRVRLNGMRIWLTGVKPKVATAVVKLRLETDGLYGDFSETATFTFATQPLKRAFWYEIGGASAKILLDSVVPDVFHNAPTPFAQWRVTLVNPTDFDLTGLTDITFELSGTAYGL